MRRRVPAVHHTWELILKRVAIVLARLSASSGTGVLFELRVDDTPTTQGRARAALRPNEIGPALGRRASITAVFPALAAGPHMINL